MLNQYYEFLTKSLIRWLESQKNLKPGNKYFVLLDNQEDTSNFYQTFQKMKFEGKVSFRSEQYNYETVAFNTNGTKVLFVAPTNNVTQDFLVTVRNRVNSNQGEWENTAVFFMVHNSLDSIIGGAYDVSQKDAPFHSENIKNEVIEEIINSKIAAGDKKILESYLNEITNQSMTVLKDYETLFSILETGKISVEDFNTMGYFPDLNINTYDTQTIGKRLEQNHEYFERVEVIHQFSDVKERLNEEFQGDGTVADLSKEDEWKKVDFSRVNKAKEAFDKDNIRNIEIAVEQIKENDETFWFRQHGESKAQRRKAHVMVSSFNVKPGGHIEFEIPFDDKIRRSDINKAGTYLYNEQGEKHADFEVHPYKNILLIRIRNVDYSKTFGGQIQFKHYDKNNLKFRITLMMVPFSLQEIKHLRSGFQVKIVGTIRNRNFYYGVSNQKNQYQIGDGRQEVTVENKHIIDYKDISNSTLVMSENFSGETVEDVRFKSYIGPAYFPIELLDIDYKPVPVQAISIERQRLGEKNSQFVYRDHKIYTGSRNISIEKSYQKYLDIEALIINKKSLFGKMLGSDYQDVYINIPTSIRNAYEELYIYYSEEETILSLAIPNEENIRLLENIIHSIKIEFENNLVDDKPLKPEIREIASIGIILEDDVIKVTPLNPLQIVYQLELYRELKASLEIPREAIISTLNAENLMPYVQVDNKHYQSSYTRNYPRWLFYNKIVERQLSDLSSDIIKKRLDDYLNQYQFLFSTNSYMTLNVAAIDIVDESNFFDAVINFMVNRLKDVKDISKINPISLYVNKVGMSITSLFHQLYKLTTIEDLNSLLKNNISKRDYQNFEDYELIEMLQNKINIYRLPKENSKQSGELFFHITFYQFPQKDNINKINMNDISKNYGLSGLLNNNQFYLVDDQYINGFGLGSEAKYDSDLIKFTAAWNSFIASINNVTDIYRENRSLVNYIPKVSHSELNPIFDSSGWVTLLNLDVDLSYFYDENNPDLLVIHYSDQNASNQYESVTVTNDIRQYAYLLNIHLESYATIERVDTEEIIKNFNAINGQWLLKLVSDKQKLRGNQHIFREKLSIIAAYKELLGILEHPNMYWVPIALEEVLRVSGIVGLSKSDGLFSAKNLGHSGNTSDDLLMMGVEESDDGLKLHFLPVEVKIGVNESGVRTKAISQVENTYELLNKFLSEKNEDIFMQKYYLNFFTSLMTSNLERMLSSGIYTVDSIPNFEIIKEKLRMGQFTLSNEMIDYYGKGLIFEFTKDQNARTSYRLSEQQLSVIKVPEVDAYNIVSFNTRDIINAIASGNFDFDPEILLSNRKPINTNEISLKKQTKPIVENEKISDDSTRNNYEKKSNINENIINFDSDDKYTSLSASLGELKPVEMIAELDDPYFDEKEINFIEPENEMLDLKEISTQHDDMAFEKQTVNLTDKRILIGKVLNSNYDAYWEYGHKGLSNRHMLITGKSGQGKTYFIQTLLYELSKNSLNALVVDYTDGFLATQLEEQLTQKVGNKINHKIIYQDLMPLNPFKIQKIDLGGITIDEKPLDMVERVVQIIDFVFSLGIQQRTLLTETILDGYRLNGKSYTFSHLREELTNSDDSGKQNLYGRISSLLKRDPFAYDNNFTWANIFNNTGEIHIFQLTGFQRQIQQVMIEFMLWDLFQYAAKSGTEAKPLPIVLDEIQNLNFNANSPTVKILREGRKFGLSGIFATQSLDSMKGTDSEAIYNATQQVHFLPPDTQVKSISKSLTSSVVGMKDIESQLKSLHKGEAIVNGPTLNGAMNITAPQNNVVKITSFENRTS